MTRDTLLNSICPMSRVYDCCIADGDYNCDKCKRLTKEWFDEYDKHVIEQYKADTNLKDTIREIHDRVAQEMYCKGIDDFVEKVELKYLGVNPDELYEKYYPREICEQIKEIAEQLKEQICQ